jgi:uncharacterized protein
MLLDLSRLRSGVEQLDRQIDLATELAGPEVRPASPVRLVAEVRKDREKVRLVGRLETTVGVDCSRCLDPFTIAVAVTFDLLYLPAANAGPAVARAADDGDEVRADDIGVSYYEDETIDLAALAREQIVLALPMKPLCRQDCRGLCPVCGANRNHETCSCKVEWVDPRLESLRQFKKN